MTTKPKAILLKTLLTLISTLYLSCLKNPKSTQKQEVATHQKTEYTPIKDSLLVKTSILKFLASQQKLLSNNQIEEISKNVSFPLDGDVIYFMIYGDDFLKTPERFFEKKITKDIFIIESNLIFPDIYKKMFCSIDLTQELYNNKYHYRIKDKAEVYWEIDISINVENNSFAVYHNKVTENSEEEYSIFYRYQFINNDYLLSYIGSAG